MDVTDYYKFTLSSRKRITFTLNGLSQDADLQLQSSIGSQLVLSENEGTSGETFTRTLDAGTYYVRVFAYQPDLDDNTNYALKGELS